MYCLRYWARYVRKGEVKSGGIKIGNESTFWKWIKIVVFFLVELWASTLCAEVVLAIQHLLGCCILGETSQRRSAPVTKFSQPRTWISLKRASAAPQSKLCCVIPFFRLIIFRSIIQFLVVLFPLLLWLHQHLVYRRWITREGNLSKIARPEFWSLIMNFIISETEHSFFCLVPIFSSIFCYWLLKP